MNAIVLRLNWPVVKCMLEKYIAYTVLDAVLMYVPYYQRMENLVNATFHFF